MLQRFLDPGVLACISSLDLLAKTVVDALESLKMKWPKPKEDLSKIRIE